MLHLLHFSLWVGRRSGAREERGRGPTVAKSVSQANVSKQGVGTGKVVAVFVVKLGWRICEEETLNPKP